MRTETMEHHCDILVAGSGFAGALTALILNGIGFSVILVEKGQHPRFAIGESSTPIADIYLRQIAAQHDLPWLHDFSRYGSWQNSHPEIVCGLKRGFSFFKHYPSKHFASDANHSQELLVAASTDQIQSDTNWLRADFDSFLTSKVKEAGIPFFDLTVISEADRSSEWAFHCMRLAEAIVIHAGFFIDATGNGILLDKLLGVASGSTGFLTDSFSLYSHFTGVCSWKEQLQQAGIATEDFPYNADDSALHQILDEGWLWMLRFNDERISCGFVLNGQEMPPTAAATGDLWNRLLEKYPSIGLLFKDSTLASLPGKIILSPRLQRKTDRCTGQGWAALPHTAGFVDPLFSSGIGHSLAGILRLTQILKDNFNDTVQLHTNLKRYEFAVFSELQFIDRLISGCYRTMRWFPLFNAWSMLYFASAIAYEQRLLLKKTEGYFLGADDPYVVGMVNDSYAELMNITNSHQPSDEDIERFTTNLKERIKPINFAGLMDSRLNNMYHHTAVNI